MANIKEAVKSGTNSSFGCPCSIRGARYMCTLTCKTIVLLLALVTAIGLCVLSTSLKSTSLIRLLVECVSGNIYSLLLALGYLCLQLSIYVIVTRWIEKKKNTRLTQEQTTPSTDSSSTATSTSSDILRRSQGARRKLTLDKAAKGHIQDCNYEGTSPIAERASCDIINQSAAIDDEEQKSIEAKQRRRNAFVYEDQNNFSQDSDFSSHGGEEGDTMFVEDKQHMNQSAEDTNGDVSHGATETHQAMSNVAYPENKLKHPNIHRMQTISWKSLDSGNFSESKEFLSEVNEEREAENEDHDQYKDIWSHDNMKKYFFEDPLSYGADIVAETFCVEIEQAVSGVNLWDSIDGSYMFNEIPRKGISPPTLADERLTIRKSKGGNVWLTSDYRRRFQLIDIVSGQSLQASTTAPEENGVRIPQSTSSTTTLTRMCSESDIDFKSEALSHALSLKKTLDLIPSTISRYDDCCTVSTDSSRRSSISGDSGTDCSAATGIYSFGELKSQRSRISQRSRDSHRSRNSNSNSSHLSLHELDNSGLVNNLQPEPLVVPSVTGASTPDRRELSLLSTATRSSHFKLKDVIEHLQVAPNATIEEEPEDYTAFIREISRVCSGCEDLKLPLHCPAPGDHYNILVQGPGVCKVKAELEELTRRFYSKYKITVSDTEPAFVTSEGLPVYTSHLVDTKKMPFYLNKQIYSVMQEGLYEEDNVSTVGVFVKDNSLDQVFAVTSAHALTIAEEEKKLAAGGGSDRGITRAICGNVIGRARLDEKLSIKPHNEDSVDVNDLTLISYRLFIKSDSDAQRAMLSHQKMMTDIALLPVGREDLPGWILEQDLSPIQSHLRLHPPINNNIEQSCAIRIAGILNIQDPKEIGALLGKRIQVFVENTTGVMERQPIHDTCSEDWQIAHHIAFTTEKALMRGNSGSAVMVYNKDDDEFYVIGILMGQFKGNPKWKKTALYQAILLGPALKQLERLYPDKIAGQLDLVCGNILLGSEMKSVLLHLQKKTRQNVDSGFIS